MKRSTYILILLLITVRFFDIKPIGEIMNNYSGFIWLLFLYFWIYIGFLQSRKSNDHPLCVKKYMIPCFFIVGGIILSMIPAYLFHGQSIITSFLSYRRAYIWVFLFIILYMNPQPKNVIKALSLFSILFFLMSILKTLFYDKLFFIPFSVAGDWALDHYDGEFIVVGGLGWLIIPLYYYSEQVRDCFSKKALRYMLFLFFLFLIVQNRSTLFGATFIILLMMISKKTRYRAIYFVAIAFVLIIFFIYTSEIWRSLIEETSSQLDDDNYNRMKAFMYFVYEANKNWVTIILGNGFLSRYSTLQMYDLMESGIVNSDMGMIGFWNQFGIIPVFVFVFYSLKAIFHKHMPLYVKAIGLHFLIGAFTMCYFAFDVQALLFILFYYLYSYYDSLSFNNVLVQRKI